MYRRGTKNWDVGREQWQLHSEDSGQPHYVTMIDQQQQLGFCKLFSVSI